MFFFTVAFIYVDTVAPKDVRHSAQSLITVIVLGIGNYLGSLFAGWVQTHYTSENVTNWTGVFIVPVALTVICAIAFLTLFKEEKTQPEQTLAQETV